MPSKNRQQGLRVGDRARSTVDKIAGQLRYGLRYDEVPQDRYLTLAGRDGAQLPPEPIERA